MMMLRSSSVLISRNLSCSKSSSSATRRSKFIHEDIKRFASSGEGGGNSRKGGKFIGILTAGTSIGIGGVIGYAALDKEFRSTVEQNLPGSSEIFSLVLGNVDGSSKPSSSAPPSKLRPSSSTPFPITSITPKESLEQKKATPDSQSPSSIPPPPPPPLPPIDESFKEEIIKKEEKEDNFILKEDKPEEKNILKEEKLPVDVEEKPVTSSKVETTPSIEKSIPETLIDEHINEVEESKNNKANLEGIDSKKDDDSPLAHKDNYESKFNDLISLMKSITDKAGEKGEETIESVKTHMNLLQGVMENSNISERDETAWNKVFEAANIKSESIAKCNEVIDEAKTAIQNVIDEIEIGQKNKVPANILLDAENKVKLYLTNLEKIHSKLVHVQQESKVVDDFRDLVEEGKQKFRQEMASLLPSKSDLFENGVEGTSQLTEEDLNLFIQHAYRKVLYLQQELAKQKTLEQLRFKRYLESQKVAANIETSDSVMSALDRQRKDLEVEFTRKLESVREEMEFEMRNQLKRLTAAHIDHLKDIKGIQESEFQRELQRKMHEFMEKEIYSAQSEITKIRGSYEGIVAALENRSNADKETSEAQQLWLNATALHEVSHQTSSDGIIEISSLVDKLKKSNDSFVSTIASNIENSLTSIGDLRKRFVKVERVARQTALLKDDNVSYSPFTLFLSYLQSKFMWVPSSTEDLPSKNSDFIDVENLTTFDIVWLAKGSLDLGDIEQTVKYMTLLRGVPGKVAKDWISDARKTLEIQQASDALIAYAASINLQCLPK